MLGAYPFDNDGAANRRQATWERQTKSGAMNPKRYKSRGGNGAIRCKNGVAQVIPGDPMNTFRCKNVRTASFEPLETVEASCLTLSRRLISMTL